MLKNTTIYFLILSTLSLMIFLIIFSYDRHSKRFIKKLNLSIDSSNKYRFANEKNIRNFIYELQGPIEKKPIKKVQLFLIEKKLKNLDFIKQSQVYIDINGELYVNIWQKKPIIRIKTDSKNYYITEEGTFMNICPWYSPEVLLAEGIFLKTDIKILKKIIQYIDNDELLKNQIIGVQKISSKSFNFIPKVGNYVIKFGNLSNYKYKFEKLKSFYREYINFLEERTYKNIYLQYSGQVVAEKI